MEVGKKRRYLQVAQELRRYLNSEEYRTHKPDQAFTHWYMRARFGDLSPTEKRVTDGSGDGGIDGVVSQNNHTTLFQMKYEVVPRIGNVTRDELSGFERLAKLFLEPSRDDEFQRWLQSVRTELRPFYQKVYRDAQRSPRSVNFVFVTTKLSALRSRTVKIEDVKRVLSLWDLYREGFTPPTESIHLKLQQPFNVESEDNNFTTYVGLADVRDFIKLMEDDNNERLFAQNVRTDLRSSINREIRRTYEKSPTKFWLGNNGVYMVCKEVQSSGKHFELIYPSIINGSQTLHSIASSSARHECMILVRILEMDVLGNQKLLGEVIRRTNTQNPMKLVNLLAHDPIQLNIARFLDNCRVFYERREGEWKNEKKEVMSGDYLTLNVKELGQWLSTLDPSIGLGRARSRTSELFQEAFYGKIFGGFGRDLQGPAYKDLVFVVWAGLFVKQLLRRTRADLKLYLKIPHLLVIRGIVEAIKSDKELEQRIETALENHRVGKRNIPPKLQAYFIGTIVNGLRKRQRAYQRSHPQTDYSNFFKLDKLSAETYQAIFSRKSIKSLSRLLGDNVPKIG